MVRKHYVLKEVYGTAPNRYGNLNSLEKFKQQIKTGESTSCIWKLYKAC